MSVLIRGGVVYDGTSKTPKETNILIRGKTISRLERVPDNPSYETIDAAGCEVVPGLFDVSSDLFSKFSIFKGRYSGTFGFSISTCSIRGSGLQARSDKKTKAKQVDFARVSI